MMRAITLWQPWASLMANEAKKDETRNSVTKVRGEVAICASLKWTRQLKDAETQTASAVQRRAAMVLPSGLRRARREDSAMKIRPWKKQQRVEFFNRPKPHRRLNIRAAVESYMEFTRGPGYDHDPLRRYVRAHGGHCSGGGGCS